MRGKRLEKILLCVISVFLAQAGYTQEAGYVLRQMDVVSIQVFGEDDLSSTQRVDANGKIRMGLLGTVDVAGLSLREAEAKLQELFVQERYLRDPQVAMSVLQYAPQFVSILGQVAKPGRIELEGESGGIRLVDAISAVGGFTGIAKSDAVRITRTEPDGAERVVTVNATRLVNGKADDFPEEFVLLQAGDVVNVPERLF